MVYKDLREFINKLESLGQLVRVEKEIESGHEIFTILWELYSQEGPAIILKKVKGHDVSIVSNVLGTLDRWALACGLPMGKSWKDYRNMFMEKLDKSQWKKPKIVSDGPCKENIFKGNKVNLYKFPILRWHPYDGGPYINMPIVITKDPDYGVNVGIYRMMVYDKDITGIMCNIMQHIGIHLARALESGKDHIECAVAIGTDPSIYLAASTKIPFGENEFEFASALRNGQLVELVACETVDLEVPATSEIVLEGEISTKERRTEGPCIEFHGYAEEVMELPIFKLKCITHRDDPLYLMTSEGHPNSEGEMIRYVQYLGMFAKSASMYVNGFVDAWLPRAGRGNLAVISIKKRYPGWGKQAVYQALAIPYIASSVNCVIVVDDDIDPANDEQVIWALSTRVDPEHDVIITPPIGTYPLNPAARRRVILESTKATDIALCSKIGIDATLKTKEEGYERPKPIVISPDEDMLKLVRQRWFSYGFHK